MKLQISYYKFPDILLMQNGRQWSSGGNVAEDVVAFVDAERNPVAIEVSGAGSLLRQVLYGNEPSPKAERNKSLHGRPDEIELDRTGLPLMVNYDRQSDVLTIETGLPMPFRQAIADGLVALYDGEDDFGKFINGVRLENAAKLLKPYLSP
jgi:hypothetical protein